MILENEYARKLDDVRMSKNVLDNIIKGEQVTTWLKLTFIGFGGPRFRFAFTVDTGLATAARASLQFPDCEVTPAAVQYLIGYKFKSNILEVNQCDIIPFYTMNIQ